MPTTRITIYVTNIPASETQPFKIELNEQEFFETKHTLTKQQTATLFADMDADDEELTVNLRFIIPIKGIDAVQEFNITNNGSFILIQLVPSGGSDERLSLRQTHKDPQQQQSSSSNSQQQQSDENEMTVAQLHVSNIPASVSEPFELILGGKVVFKSVDDMSTQDQQGKIAIVTARLPKPKYEDHIVPLTVRVLNQERQMNLNFSRDGCYVKVYIPKDDNQVDIWQSHDDHFHQSTSTKPYKVQQQQQQQQRQQQSVEQIDYIKEIESLASLRNAGILSNEEFELKKKKLLGL